MALSCSKKKLLVLLRGITLKNIGDFYFSNCFHSFRTKSKLKLNEKLRNSKHLCGITLPTH